MSLNRLNTLWYSFMIHSVAIIKNVVDTSVTEVESTMFY